MTDWQPIETAPKEGSFLVWDGSDVLVADRDGNGFLISIYYTGPSSADGLGLTHWMPLPDPPKD